MQKWRHACTCTCTYMHKSTAQTSSYFNCVLPLYAVLHFQLITAISYYLCCRLLPLILCTTHKTAHIPYLQHTPKQAEKTDKIALPKLTSLYIYTSMLFRSSQSYYYSRIPLLPKLFWKISMDIHVHFNICVNTPSDQGQKPCIFSYAAFIDMSMSDLSKDSEASKLSNFSIEAAAALLLSVSTAC